MRFDSASGVTGRDIGQQGRSTTASGPDRARCDPLACATGLSAVISDNRLPCAILRGAWAAGGILYSRPPRPYRDAL